MFADAAVQGRAATTTAYRQVVVTPIVAGRVTKVGPALGDRARQGQTIAEIYSPALERATRHHFVEYCRFLTVEGPIGNLTVMVVPCP
jgi:hypothetical protein